MVVVTARARSGSGSTGTSASEDARNSGGDVEEADDDGFEIGARLLRTTDDHDYTVEVTARRRRRDGADEYKVRYESFHFPRRRDEWVSSGALRAYVATPRRKSRGDRSRARTKPVDAGGGRAPSRRRAAERGTRRDRGDRERAKSASSSGDHGRCSSGKRARARSGEKTRREPARGRKERKTAQTAAPPEAPPRTLSEEERAKRTIRVFMQPSLRKVLLYDYEASRGTDPRPFVEPRVTVVDILNRFLASASPPTTNKVKATRAEAVVRGFEACFDRSLDANLLYKDEWHNPRVDKPSERYGALHLLRMLAKLPAMFPPESFAEDADALLVQTKANELAKFLASRAVEFGAHETAIDVTLAPSTPENDKYYYLAKEQGFRSRAAFKLVQLNRKYDFLSKARACMDLCAAPGGWLQVAQKYMPMSSTIVGVDLAPIRPIRGVTTLVEDITTQSCRAALKRVTPQGLKYDVVIHDGAPNVGGNFAKESYTQAALTLDSLRLATEFLGPGGWFVTKVFRSVEYHALLYACQQLFKKVESTKPVASRGTSAEIYVVCSGYLAPTKIDPRLLDAKHLFADTEAEAQPVDVTKDGKRKRNRSGYEDGVSTLYKECAAEDFIMNDKPGEMLGLHHAFILDGKNHKGLEAPEEGWMDLDDHPTTTDEIRSLMSDLGVLGKADFKILLRWRMTIRKEAGLEKKKHQKGRRGQTEDSSDESSDESSGDEDEASDGDEDDEEEKDQLLNEMSELKSSMDAQARRDKKKKAKIKAKERLRVARGLASSGEAIVEQEMDLFSLARIKTKGALDVVSKAPTPGLGAAHDSDEEPDAVGDDSDAESDSEEDERRLDKEVDDMWEMYKARRMKKGEKFTEPSKGRDKRTQLGAGELDDEDEDEDDEDASDPADDEFKSDSDELEWEDDDEEEEEVPKSKRNKTKKDSNPLVVDLGTKQKKNAAKAADMWFSNDLFSSGKKSAVAATDAGSESDEEDEPPAKEKKKKEKKKSAKPSKKEKGAAADEEEEENFDHLRAKAREAKEKKAKADAKVANAKRGKGARDDTYDDESDEETTRQKGRKGANDFEVVAAEEDVEAGSESDSGYEYDSEVDELSDDTRARILALGQKMIRKKDREELIEDAYNRYAFDDDDVPDWFAEDERRFMKPIPQYTAAELAEAKAQLAAVNTRPIKKVAEANWRKKKRAEAKIAQARVRAAAIIEQDDVPDVSKAKEIERVFAKARRSAAGGVKKPRKVVVARKYHRGNAGGPSVDKRQLADLRGQRASAKRAGKGARGGGKGKGGRGGGRGKSRR